MFLDSTVVVEEADVDLQSGLNRVDICCFSSELQTLAFKYKCDACGVSASTVPDNTVLKSRTTKAFKRLGSRAPTAV